MNPVNLLLRACFKTDALLVFAVLLSSLFSHIHLVLYKYRPSTPAATTQNPPNRMVKLLVFSSILGLLTEIRR